MEADTTYTYIEVCPETGSVITETRGFGGVCPFCGDDNTMSYIHSAKVVGRWNRPSWQERWFEGKKAEFIRKDDEDKLMKKLAR